MSGRLGSLVDLVLRNTMLRREADMMAITVCVALLAALSFGDDHTPHSQFDVLLVVWGTTIGLALTHWFALLLSVHLVRDTTFTNRPGEMLVAHLAMAVLVAAAATTAVLILTADFERLGARVTAALFLGGLVSIESRARGSSWPRTALIAVGAIAIGSAIAAAKWYVGR